MGDLSLDRTQQTVYRRQGPRAFLHHYKQGFSIVGIKNLLLSQLAGEEIASTAFWDVSNVPTVVTFHYLVALRIFCGRL